MISLETEFAGVRLRNPVVIAACPATESVENIIMCAKAGAGAVITKSIASYDAQALQAGYRRTYVDRRGMWAMSTYRRETLTLEAGRRLVAEAVERTNIPIIASVTALDTALDSWYPTCVAVREAGASMIQLDFFYLPQPVCTPRNAAALTALVSDLSRDIEIPIVPKLNLEIPALFAAEAFKNTGIAGISLLDSVHVPPPILPDTDGRPAHRFVEKPSRASLFGSWQLPLTLHYTYLLSRFTSFPLCVGGGLMDSHDVIEVMMLGATTVQFATAVLLYGYGRITEIVREIERFLEQRHLDNVGALRGLAYQYLGSEGETKFTAARAQVDHDLCIRCDRCLDLAFCTAITLVDEYIQIIQSRCDGCGLCTFYCKVGALKVEAMS